MYIYIYTTYIPLLKRGDVPEQGAFWCRGEAPSTLVLSLCFYLSEQSMFYPTGWKEIRAKHSKVCFNDFQLQLNAL